MSDGSTFSWEMVTEEEEAITFLFFLTPDLEKRVTVAIETCHTFSLLSFVWVTVI